jgi:hypothetical protein
VTANTQAVSEKVTGDPGAIDLVVARHHRPGTCFLDRSLECGKADLVEREAVMKESSRIMRLDRTREPSTGRQQKQ